jgi:predicted ATPase
MSKIRIKNFGPIKEGFQENDGWIDVKKVTVFIGNQGSGKSTVAKVIATLTWLEKAINRGDYPPSGSFYDFVRHFDHQGLRGYFKLDTIIDYKGDLFSIYYNPDKERWPIFEKNKQSNYIVPQIMYVPDSRNFLSVITNATGVRGLPIPLFQFAAELKRWQTDTGGQEIPLPINGVNYKYEAESDSSFIIGKDFRVNLLAASSGFQSLVPLFLTSSSLARITKSGYEISPANISVDQSIRMNNEISTIMLDNQITGEEKLKRVEDVKAKFQNKAFINIVEEPEQNLFPTSQRQMLNSLLEFNNMSQGNKLIMTTHSPYIISYLTLAVEANKLKPKVNSDDLKAKLNEIVPLVSTVDGNDLVVYQLDEKNGTIEKLKAYKGLPSDENYLNESLAESNDEFSKLLDLEDLCQ